MESYKVLDESSSNIEVFVDQQKLKQTNRSLQKLLQVRL